MTGNRIFDGNPYLSPVFVALLVLGIFVMAACPPVGIPIAIGGYVFQHRRRAKFRRAARAHLRHHQVRAHRERILAFKSL